MSPQCSPPVSTSVSECGLKSQKSLLICGCVISEDVPTEPSAHRLLQTGVSGAGTTDWGVEGGPYSLGLNWEEHCPDGHRS